jgi:hypothetical protein
MCLEAPHRSLGKRGTSVVLATNGNIIFPFGIIAMSTNVNISAQRPNPPPSYTSAGVTSPCATLDTQAQQTDATTGRAVANHRAKPLAPVVASGINAKPFLSGLEAGLTKSCLLRHGGKRKAKGQTRGLSDSNVKAIINAGAASLAVGAPLNRFVTVHWGALGLGDNEGFKATSRLMTFARDWLRDRGVKANWLWVRENDDGDGSKGSHVHWLLHLPETYREAFNGRLQSWCIKAAGADRYVKNAIKSLPVGRHVDTHATAPDLYCANLRKVLNYVLKGLTPQASQMAAERLNAIWAGNGAAMPNVGTGGVVIGKRVGFSRGLFQPAANQG